MAAGLSRRELRERQVRGPGSVRGTAGQGAGEQSGSSGCGNPASSVHGTGPYCRPVLRMDRRTGQDEAVTIRGVQLFSVPVSDQDRARDFYVERLGMELVDDQPMGPGRRWVRVRPAGGETAITLVTWFDSMPAGSLKGLVLETDDVEGDARRLREQGVPIEGGLQEAPWGRYIQLRDPDGNGLILQETVQGESRFR